MISVTNLQKRFLMFLLGCIVIRLLFVYIAKNININKLPFLGYISIILVIGFILIFITKSRETGFEVFGEKIWWNNLRPIHSLLYGIFAYNAINKNPNSWVFLLIDVLFGLGSFLTHHYLENNFSKIIFIK